MIQTQITALLHKVMYLFTILGKLIGLNLLAKNPSKFCDYLDSNYYCLSTYLTLKLKTLFYFEQDFSMTNISFKKHILFQTLVLTTQF